MRTFSGLDEVETAVGTHLRNQRGCIEAAAVSGLQAANGVLARPHWDRITGQFLR